MTDTMATPSNVRDLIKPWGDDNPINHMGLFQQLERIIDGGFSEEVCRAKRERDRKE